MRLVVLALCFCLLIVSCDNNSYEETIIGKWNSVSSSRVKWTFSADGVCTYSNGTVFSEGTYSLQGDELKTMLYSINFADNTSRMSGNTTSTYRILRLSYLNLVVVNTKTKARGTWQRTPSTFVTY